MLHVKPVILLPISRLPANPCFVQRCSYLVGRTGQIWSTCLQMAETRSVPVKVLFFAKARDLAGTSDAKLELPASLTGNQCRQKIEKVFPALAALKGGYVLALNEQYVDLQAHEEEKLCLKDSDEIAVIPPLSGG